MADISSTIEATRAALSSTGGSVSAPGSSPPDTMAQQIQIQITTELALARRDASDAKLALQHEVQLRRAAQAEISAMGEEAEEATVTRSRYLGHAGHEIRTMMTSILGFADLLLDTSLTDTQRQKLRNLKAAGTSLSLIINEILDISALQAGQLQFECGPANLRGIVDDILSTFSERAAVKNLFLRGEMAPDLPDWVHVDATRLRQLLHSLVGKGIKFTLQGGVRIEVTRGLTNAPDMVRFEVIDTGPGISPDQREVLFRPFESPHACDRPDQGTGLSLAISKSLVEAMGGTIGVGCVAGHGSRFWFELPLAGVPEPVGSIEQTGPPLERKGRILVAEDLPMNQMIIKEILEVAGHSATIVGDGIDAISVLSSDEFDLVLMDIAMPVMGGLETARAIRMLDGKEAIPILALTAHAMPDQIAACRAAGMDDYLSKPIDRTHLLEKIRWWLNRSPSPVQSLNVLVVDDCSVTGSITSTFLRSAGHQVNWVENGREAVALVSTTDFDVVLMDIRMQPMDGLEATRQIRSLEGQRGRVPIVAVTAQALAHEIEACHKAGMNGHLSKPFNRTRLQTVVVEAAAGRSAPMALKLDQIPC
jgi:CheY-like chemotaxis protein/signal transduction histidine kinase